MSVTDLAEVHNESVSVATAPSPSPRTTGIPGTRSLAASPTATLTRSSEVTAATTAQWWIPSSSSVARSSPRPIATGMPAASASRTPRRVWGSLDRDDGNAAPLQLLGEPEADLPEADQQARVHGRGRLGHRTGWSGADG
ncbi:MAG: hypothetical protein M3Y17_09715 [Actinomycetota bacterium]|nr:hypothetical protein [Actinomycetota bacterium]